MPKPKSACPAIRAGSGKDFGASGKARPAEPRRRPPSRRSSVRRRSSLQPVRDERGEDGADRADREDGADLERATCAGFADGVEDEDREAAACRRSSTRPVHTAIDRSQRWPTTQRTPSFSSGHIFGLGSPATRSGSTSRWRMRSMNTVETTKLAASAMIAYGRRDRADQHARPARPGDLRHRDGELELRVAVDELLAVDERREVRLIRDVEEDGADPDHELEDEQVPEAQGVGRPEDRDEREQHRAGRVAGDEDRPAAQAVDPDAGGQREEDERQEAEHAEQRELDRRGVQLVGGEQRDREGRDRRAELADRLSGPELEEVGVAPEAAGRAARPTHRAPSGRARREAVRPRRRRCRRRGSRRSAS